MMISIPLSAVFVGFLLLYLSIVSFDGLVTDDYYKEGLALNQSLERDQAAITHSLRGYLRFNPEREMVQMDLQSATDYPLPQQVRLSFTHPTRPGYDQRIVLERIDTQTYQGRLPMLQASGHWQLQLEADDWRLFGTATMPGTTQLILGQAS
jgi:hypothetical protein